MRKYLLTSLASALLLCNTVMAADESLLKDSDMPAIRDALQKAYTLDLCHKDIPDASAQTCECLGKVMADNLNADKLKMCKKEGYAECVTLEFAAAKSSVTEKQINDCKAIGAGGGVPAADAPAAAN